MMIDVQVLTPARAPCRQPGRRCGSAPGCV